MENAVEALKIAFAVMMFVMALSLSISSLSQANSAVTAIIGLNDRETEYNYVEPSGQGTRIVGVETIVPMMYKAYQENFEIYFFNSNGEELPIYYKTDQYGNNLKENNDNIEISYINGSEVFANATEAVNHLNQILAGPNNIENFDSAKYGNQVIYQDGFYDLLQKYQFIEQLGEYYENDGENTPEAQKVTKRVITYTSTSLIQ